MQLHDGPFSGRLDFQKIVRDALAAAASEGWREIILCDPSFEDWPLGERAVLESLTVWAQAGRSLTLLAKRYDTLRTTHHRFVTWRGQWSHLIDARAVPSADPIEFPSGIYSPGWIMQRHDLVRSSGVCSAQVQRRVQLQELLREWQGKSSPAFPATTLGL